MVDDYEVDIVVVVFFDFYGRLMGKWFDVSYFLESIVEYGTYVCNYLLMVDMEMELVSGYQFVNWDWGYGDFYLVFDFNTFCPVNWLFMIVIVFCDVIFEFFYELLLIVLWSFLKT